MDSKVGVDEVLLAFIEKIKNQTSGGIPPKSQIAHLCLSPYLTFTPVSGPSEAKKTF